MIERNNITLVLHIQHFCTQKTIKTIHTGFHSKFIYLL